MPFVTDPVYVRFDQMQIAFGGEFHTMAVMDRIEYFFTP